MQAEANVVTNFAIIIMKIPSRWHHLFKKNREEDPDLQVPFCY